MTARQIDEDFRVMSDEDLKRWEAQRSPWFELARLIVMEFQPEPPPRGIA